MAAATFTIRSSLSSTDLSSAPNKCHINKYRQKKSRIKYHILYFTERKPILLNNVKKKIQCYNNFNSICREIYFLKATNKLLLFINEKGGSR